MVRSSPRKPFLERAFLVATAMVSANIASAGELQAADMTAPSRSISSLFGSTALRVSRSALNPLWRAAAWPRIKGDSGPWAEIVDAARKLPKEERLDLVNRWVNGAIRFRADADQYGEPDHWADLAESMASGEGDCEDYAIAKLQLLRSLGYSSRDLYIMIVRDTAQGQDHAVLVVRSGRRFLLLDNQRDEIADPAVIAEYRPTIGFNGSSAWLYRQELTFSASPAPAS